MTATSPATSARPVYTDIGKALGTDYFLLKADLTAEERDYLERTRRFVHDEVLPHNQRLLGTRGGAPGPVPAAG